MKMRGCWPRPWSTILSLLSLILMLLGPIGHAAPPAPKSSQHYLTLSPTELAQLPPLVQAEISCRKKLMKSTPHATGAYRHLLITIENFLKAQGVAYQSLPVKHGLPVIQILDQGTHPLNILAQDIAAHGFKLIYLSPADLRSLDDTTTIYSRFYDNTLIISAWALSDIPRFCNSEVLKIHQEIIQLRTAHPWAYQALNEVLFMGKNFAALPETPDPKLLRPTMILDRPDHVYIMAPRPGQDPAEVTFNRPIIYYQKIKMIARRTANYTVNATPPHPHQPMYVSARLRKINQVAFNLLLTAEEHLHHLNNVLYIMLHHPENVSYRYSKTRQRLNVWIKPDLQNAFYYELNLPWPNPLPSRGDTSVVLKNPIFQTYFRFLYGLVYALRPAELGIGKDILSITPPRLKELIQAWQKLQDLPTNIESKVAQKYWWPSKIKAKISYHNPRITRLFRGVQRGFARRILACPNLLTAPPDLKEQAGMSE